MIKSISQNMVYTEAELEEMLAASKPLIKWLNANSNPHCAVIVTTGSAEIFSSYGKRNTEEFIKD